jgi:hypothetical protein
MENDDFYKFVVELSSIDHSRKHLDETSDRLAIMIARNYKKNILIAANKGLDKAYLCVYKTDTIIDEKILIDSFIRMDAEMILRFQEYKLEPVIDRIKRIIKPFVLHIEETKLANETIISIYTSWNKK